VLDDEGGAVIPAGWTTKQVRVYLERENKKWPSELIQIDQKDWPYDDDGTRRAVFRSRKYIVQIFSESCGFRISVNRTTIKPGTSMWDDSITWDELQSIKSEIGYADWWAAELYPPSTDVVNVANMRHLWLLPAAPEFGWKRDRVELS